MLKENKMNIIKATYGEIDCTQQIQSRVNGNKLIIRSNNDIIGDTQPGVVKYLELQIEHEDNISDHKIDKKKIVVDVYVILKPSANSAEDKATLDRLIEDFHSSGQILKVSRLKYNYKLFKNQLFAKRE